MKTLLLGIASLLLLSSCATQELHFKDMSVEQLANYNSTASLPNKVYCSNEVRVGSHIRKRSCRKYLENIPGYIGTLDTASSSSSYSF